MNDFGGGVLHEFGAYAFFKRLVDVISFQFLNKQIGIIIYLHKYFSKNNVPITSQTLTEQFIGRQPQQPQTGAKAK